MPVKITMDFILSQIESYPDQYIYLNELGAIISMSPRTLAEQIKRKKIKATLSGNRYRVNKEEARRLATQNFCRILGWNRLVDVCKEHGIHRNIGESICRQHKVDCGLDLNGHMRIPPEGEEEIGKWVEEKRCREDWVRKTDFAKEIGEHPTLVDTVCRKLKLAIDHDMSGMVILSPEAQAGFVEWRDRRDLHRNGVIEQGKRTFYSLAKTAEDAALYFAEPNAPGFEKITKTYYRRFSFWIQEGLPYKTLKGKKYFSRQVYNQLVDDLSVAEAARVAGVCKTTIKSWIRSGCLDTKRGVAKRRSLSKQEFSGVLKMKYETSPVLRKKEMIPATILPELSEWADRIQLRGDEAVLKALHEATGLTLEELAPLRSHCGMVPRSVKRTYDEWCIKREGGATVEIHPDYQGFAASQIHKLARRIIEVGALPNYQALRHIVATYTGSAEEAAERWLFDASYEGFMNFDLGDLLNNVLKHNGATVYADHLEFVENDLLIHPHAQDFGVVTELIGHKTIKVEWKNLGSVCMAHSAGTPVERYAMAMAR